MEVMRREKKKTLAFFCRVDENPIAISTAMKITAMNSNGKNTTQTHTEKIVSSQNCYFFSALADLSIVYLSRSNIWDGNFEYVTKRKIVLLHATVCLYGNSLTLWATISCRDAERPDFSVEKCMNIFKSYD